MTTVVYVPRDAAALSVGAESVAQAIAAEAKRRNAPIRLVRNGTRGLTWLEPLVEVATPAGRHAYGPVNARDVPGLFDANFLGLGRGPKFPPPPSGEELGRGHPLYLGPTEEIPCLKSQQRLTFARVGIIDPVDLEDYIAH